MTKEHDLDNDTGFSWKQWQFRSQHKELCGILGCFNEPIEQCNHCQNWYCEEHKWVIDTPAHSK